MQNALRFLLLSCLFLFSQHYICAQTLSEAGARPEDSPTEEETREAQELFRRFIEQLEAKQDVNGLIDELFVRDFDRHLRAGLNGLVIAQFENDVLTTATDYQLRRFYRNALNSVYLGLRVYAAATIHRQSVLKQSAQSTDDTEPTFADFEAVLPPEFFDLLFSDPIVGRAALKAVQDERINQANTDNGAQNEQTETTQPVPENPQDDTDDGEKLFRISSIDRLDHYNDLLERAATIVRKRLKELTPERAPELETFLNKIKMERAEPEKDAPFSILKDTDFMGYAPDTRFISTSALLFHVDMIRDQDGQLRIAAVHFCMD